MEKVTSRAILSTQWAELQPGSGASGTLSCPPLWWVCFWDSDTQVCLSFGLVKCRVEIFPVQQSPAPRLPREVLFAFCNAFSPLVKCRCRDIFPHLH